MRLSGHFPQKDTESKGSKFDDFPSQATRNTKYFLLNSAPKEGILHSAHIRIKEQLKA